MSRDARNWLEFPAQCRAFRDECAQRFRFLYDDYGFQVVETLESGFGASIQLMSPTTGITLSWDMRDECIDVTLLRLSAPHTWSGDRRQHRPLQELAARQHQPIASLSAATVDDMRQVLGVCADVLRRLGDDVLRGDFAIFSD